MADALKTNPPEIATQPQVIRREDYRPPEWFVPEIALDFQLGLEKTVVRASLDVRQSLDGSIRSPLVLNGDGLEPLSVLVDGVATNDWTMVNGDLHLPLKGAAHRVETLVEINPSTNSQLMGLFASNGMLCSQCEAEGFRRITFFPDRPDVMSRYSVRMQGDKTLFPVLLSNGNKVAEGQGEDGTHWAQWDDPWPKPSYLFALVAGDLVANSDVFTTRSGKPVELNIWVRDGDLPRTGHAMQALKASMDWDERVYGREYDLGLFNIVAVSDFNMGAMENKGLNIFNSRYILADPETATDMDYDGIEGVVAHEYFHNWSGNRVTCRDWFQLSLKEGFTVYRDQCFSADMGSVDLKRIEDVRLLRAAQFPEDAGPLAHPIRPDSFIEISNFYTATVYNKGAEIIRMMATILGAEGFRKGTDLYFERHDGQAATCEDFVCAMEDGGGADLSRFRGWYSAPGTPRISVALHHDSQTATARIDLAQTIALNGGAAEPSSLVIPLRTALFDSGSGAHGGEQLLMLEQPRQSFVVENVQGPPILSINRGFSAPVIVESGLDQDALAFLARHDDDAFNRFDAMQQLMAAVLLQRIAGGAGDAGALAAAIRAVLLDPQIDHALRAEMILLPSETYIGDQMPVVDPDAIHVVREGLKAELRDALSTELMQCYQDAAPEAGFSLTADARAKRKLRNILLLYLAAGEAEAGLDLAYAQFAGAHNMTAMQGALSQLAHSMDARRDAALEAFYTRFRHDPLVIDKWFAIQAMSLRTDTVDAVKALAQHSDFTMSNPNRVRALYGTFAGNQARFHDASGTGYRFLADMIVSLDKTNPQTAARMVPPLGRWRRFEPGRSALMRAALESIAAQPNLSRDVGEQVSKSLS
jgi:aminopeptidase N